MYNVYNVSFIIRFMYEQIEMCTRLRLQLHSPVANACWSRCTRLGIQFKYDYSP